MTTLVRCCLCSFIIFVHWCSTVSAQVVDIPDANLENAIREELNLSDNTPITQQEMLKLAKLDVGGNSGITDLTGLEYATNLTGLGLYHNPITDISPLAHLTKLKGFNMWGCRIVDLSPLRNLENLTSIVLGNNKISAVSPLAELTGLTYIELESNQISDISPLATLTNLTRLELNNNRIVNFSPLANLINLEVLWIHNNLGTDISSLQGLNLIEFRYDEVCDIAPLLPLVRDRIENRSFPSTFRVWSWLRGFEYGTEDEVNTLHDLSFDSFTFQPWHGIEWLLTEEAPTFGLSTRVGGNVEQAQEIRLRYQQLNPNLVSLISVSWYATGSLNRFPIDSEFWLRDDNGDIVKLDFRGRWFEYQTDFFHPGYQDLLVERIVAIATCGLIDGIMFDGFASNATGFVGRHLRPQSDIEIIAAITSMLSRIRARVRDDFLILVNGGDSKPTAYAEYVNGNFMEATQDHPSGYTREELKKIENTLLWSEKNLRAPQINCLEGWGIGNQPPDSSANQQWMRVFTTMSLTYSDGYVLYNTGEGNYGGPDHEHIWYNFWETELGQPVGEKVQRYQNVEGLFIREFTNGWAVYNRSGKEQAITLPRVSTGVSSNKQDTTHLLPDLDGEIYLKAKNPADVNGDWVVNILDLVQVANNFGKSAPDPNGDGVVNILDLVFVAQQFSQ